MHKRAEKMETVSKFRTWVLLPRHHHCPHPTPASACPCVYIFLSELLFLMAESSDLE